MMPRFAASAEQVTFEDLYDAAFNDVTERARECSLPKFMDNLLPKLPSVDWDIVLNDLVEHGWFITSAGRRYGRWKNMPKEPCGKEILYHSPLAQIANAIIHYASKEVQDAPLRPYWIDKNSTLPISAQAKHDPDLRPDLNCFLVPEDFQSEYNVETETTRAENGLHELDETSGMDSEDEQRPNTRTLPAPIPRDTAYWIRTLAFIKIISYDISDDIPFEYIVDLASSMHLMLREQQDRRFAFGLLLCHDECFIWHFDRSGLVGSGRIDINKHPKLFIRAVASLALAQPSQLGWDDTMKLGLVGDHDSRGGLQLPLRYAYSWDPRLRNCDIPKSPETVHWRIRVDDQWYTTIETLSADLVSGHASITWLAICQSEVNPEPVVIKQSWPLVNGEVGIRNEEASYQNAGPSPHLPQVRASWTVPGTKTLANLRGDAQSARSFTTCQPLVEREQVRTVLDSFGWPLQDFTNLEELLRGLLGSLKGYEHLHNNGIIHRNVSLSNIVIHWKTSEGLLINADHAKQIDKPHQTVEEMIEKSGNSDSYDLASDQVVEFVGRNESMQNLDKALAKFLLGCSSVLCGVVKPDVRKAFTGTFVQYGNLVDACAVDADPGDTLTVEDFGFTPETLFPCIPSLKFITGIRKGVDHNQYIQFTSPWLLGRFSEFEVFHSAIHDMESFFWVLLHICLLHSGPGRSQSSASNNQNTTGEREVERRARADALRTFFFDGDKDTLRVHKRTLFMKGEDGIKDHIFPFIDPYFAPLQQLILDWFRVLEAALGPENRVAVLYLFPTGFFKAALEEAMRKVASMPLTARDTERVHIMTKTREEYLAKIHSACHSRVF